MIDVNNQDQFSRLIAAARSGGLDTAAIAELATDLATSGATLSWEPTKITADLASTGGPGSLSTLITPLYLAAGGLSVVKLGVAGRPAGGIDTLGTIAGYRTSLEPVDVQHVVENCGYAHFIADDTFAPADAALFAFRKATRNLAVPSLVVASILAKKLAVGVRVVGLEIRVGPFGNFGLDHDTARENAELFCQVARQLGLRAVAFVVDGRLPAISGIGRGESLLAVQAVLDGRMDSMLNTHAERCAQMAAAMAGNTVKTTSVAINDVFRRNLTEQGAVESGFQSRVDVVTRQKKYAVLAKANGRVFLDLVRLRDTIVQVQEASPPLKARAFSDPVGVSLQTTLGAEVREGDLLAEVRLDEITSSEIVRRVDESFYVDTSESPARPFEMEIVDGA